MKSVRHPGIYAVISLVMFAASGPLLGEELAPEVVKAPEWTIPASKLVNLGHPERVPNKFIVVFKDDDDLSKDVPPPVADSLEIAPGELPTTTEGITRIGVELAGRFRSKELLPPEDDGSDLRRIKHVYTSVFRGFSLDGVSDKNIVELARDPRVKYVEAVLKGHFSSVQSSAPWDLDRIDQSVGLDGLYHYSATGAGVTVWILDTGLQWTHTEFGGRAANYTIYFSSCSPNTQNCSNTYQVCYPAGCDYYQPAENTNPAMSDNCGHGTAVASMVTGTVSGVAKGATVRGVDVVGAYYGICGPPDASQMVAGFDYVINHKAANTNIINLSWLIDLGDYFAPALETAVAQAVNSGIVVVTSAGNETQNACNGDPGRLPYVITVGGSAQNDLVWSSYSPYGSNYGPCVTLFAPADHVTVADNGYDSSMDKSGTPQGSNITLNTISGTSFSSPMVAGIAALYLQNNPNASPATVKKAITSAAWVGKLKDTRTGVLPSANLLASPCVTGNVVCSGGSGGGGSGGGGSQSSVPAIVAIIEAILLYPAKN